MDSAGSVTEECITWLQNVRYFRWNGPLDEDEYHLFPLFLAHILRLRCPPWKAWNWWKIWKAHIGHMDNRGRFQTSRKCFEREFQALAVSEKFNLFRNFIFFLWKAQKKAYACSMILTKISDFLFWRRKRLLCILRDRRQETKDIWSNSA